MIPSARAAAQWFVGESGRDDAEQEIDAEQSFDARELEAARSLHTRDDCGERGEVECELLWNEISIELE